MEHSAPKHYHLVGIAGVGMSALAQTLLAKGCLVTGSDRHFDNGVRLPVFNQLKAAGAQLTIQDGSGVKPETAGVVFSTAIEEDNPDIQAARQHDVPLVHRAKMLACLAAGHTVIAVTGTCGKTTVTGMIGWILECAGKDPTVINGGAVNNWRSKYRIGNVRIGWSPLWVIEADESDRSLLRFQPDWAVVTNISKDHFDLPETKTLFQEFASHVFNGIVCGPGVSSILRDSDFARSGPPLVCIEEPLDLFEEPEGFSFRYCGMTFNCPLLGQHNAENAFAAVVLCHKFGLDLVTIRNALGSFHGIERRLERVGDARGISVIDDYAHNPAKIKAAWTTARRMHRRVFGVWRPHGFGPLKAMLNELTDTFAEVVKPDDHLHVMPVYYAGGTADKAISSEDLVAALRERGIPCELGADYERLLEELPDMCSRGDCILCMGARDPQLPVFAKLLVRVLSQT